MNIYNTTRIVLTGPESTGKTELAKFLANHYKTIWVPEFARDYIGALNTKYSYDDVVNIAQKQIEQYKKAKSQNKLIFFDTWLIITKVWFKEVFSKYPDWLDKSLEDHPVDFYLICNTDIEWIYDPVRENKDKRDYLLDQYIKEIERINIPYSIISGKNDNRFHNAIDSVDGFLKLNSQNTTKEIDI